MDRIAIVGNSSVGKVLASRINAGADFELVRLIPARSEKYPPIECDVLIVATRDDGISEVAIKALFSCVRRPRLVVHVAGSLPYSVLPEGTERLTLHPMQTFAKPSPKLLDGITWMACSDNRKAIGWAKRFTKSLGASGLIELGPKQLPLYHTLGVFAANFVVLLGEALEEIGTGLGKDAKSVKAALHPLMLTAMENMMNGTAKEALSGPIARKDFTTIKKHSEALAALDPELRKLYDAFLTYAVSRGY